MNEESPKDVLATARKGVFSLLMLLCLVAIAAAVYFYSQTVSLRNSNPQMAAQEEIAKIVAEVEKLILLPKGEIPTVATVSDLEPLKSQPFFANAKKGDKLLLYTNAKKAILYSPTEKKIVEVAPITLGDPK